MYDDRVRRQGRKTDTGGIHPLIRRQPIEMFCLRDKHAERFRRLGIQTVAQAIEHVRLYGTPMGMSGPTWDEMVYKMSLFQEGAW